MEGKFAHILGMLGLKSNTDAVTEAHLQAADDKIALLEQEKAAAETKAGEAEAARVVAQTALDTTKASLETTQADLTSANDKLTKADAKVATLEGWKKQQQATDGRSEDESNKLDDDGQEPKAAFEVAAAAQISRVKSRLGEKS